MYLSESESATDCMATNGTLLIRKLPVGDYYFVESVTPSGYMPYGKKVELQFQPTMKTHLIYH